MFRAGVLILVLAFFASGCSSSGSSKPRVTDKAAFCKGATMEQNAQTVKANDAALRLLHDNSAGSLKDDIALAQKVAAGKGPQDAKWNAALKRIKNVAVATCHLNLDATTGASRSPHPTSSG